MIFSYYENGRADNMRRMYPLFRKMQASMTQLLNGDGNRGTFFALDGKGSGCFERGGSGLIQIHLEIYSRFLCIALIEILNFIALIGEAHCISCFNADCLRITAIYIFACGTFGFLDIDGCCWGGTVAIGRGAVRSSGGGGHSIAATGRQGKYDEHEAGKSHQISRAMCASVQTFDHMSGLSFLHKMHQYKLR